MDLIKQTTTATTRRGNKTCLWAVNVFMVPVPAVLGRFLQNHRILRILGNVNYNGTFLIFLFEIEPCILIPNSLEILNTSSQKDNSTFIFFCIQISYPPVSNRRVMPEFWFYEKTITEFPFF